MGNPYLEVARTYVDRRLLILVATILVVILVVPALSGNPRSPWPSVPFVIAFMLFEIVICYHLVEQLAYPPARLMPSFVRPHLVVAGLAAVSACMLSAAVWARVSAASLLGTTAVTFTVFALLAWAFYGWSWCQWVLILGFMAFSRDTFRHAADKVVSDSASPISATLLVASLGTLGLLVYRVAHIHRGTRQFDDPPAREVPVSSREEETVDEPKGGWIARFPQAWIDRRLDAAVARPGAGLWPAAQRIRAAVGGPPASAITAVTVALLVGFASLLSDSVNQAVHIRCNDLMYAFIVFGCAPSIGQRWRRMISDGLLRPVTRKRLFLQITAAMGQEMLDVWLGLCIGLVASWLILGASNLHEPVAWASLVAAGGFIALAGGGLAYLMGTHLEAGRSLASCLWIVATLLAWGVMTDLSKTAWSCLGWGAGALLVGASLMAAAYRRWLRVDWD